MADSTLHSGRGGLKGFRHLGVEHLGDGIGVPYGPPGSLARCNRRTLQRLSANVDDLLLSLSSRNSLLYGFENMIAKPNRKVKREPNEHFRKFSWKLSKQFLAQLSAIYPKFGIVKTFIRNLIFLKHLAGDSWHRRHPLLLARCFFVVWYKFVQDCISRNDFLWVWIRCDKFLYPGFEISLKNFLAERVLSKELDTTFCIMWV